MDTVYLSQREFDVASLRSQGLPDKEIAKKLGLGNHTVRSYMKTVHLKLGVQNGIQLTNRFRDVNAVVLSSPIMDAKQRARTALSQAVKAGKVKRGLCEKCGDPRSHGHHDDYTKPLEVRWLCKKHHDEEHRKKKV